jgi:hypothetical protein
MPKAAIGRYREGRSDLIAAFGSSYLSLTVAANSAKRVWSPESGATHCNSGVLQVISLLFGLNYPEFPDSCFWLDFCGLNDVLQVLAGGAHTHGARVTQWQQAVAVAAHSYLRRGHSHLGWK